MALTFAFLLLLIGICAFWWPIVELWVLASFKPERVAASVLIAIAGLFFGVRVFYRRL
jgi:hypothetical protein